VKEERRPKVMKGLLSNSKKSGFEKNRFCLFFVYDFFECMYLMSCG